MKDQYQTFMEQVVHIPSTLWQRMESYSFYKTSMILVSKPEEGAQDSDDLVP